MLELEQGLLLIEQRTSYTPRIISSVNFIYSTRVLSFSHLCLFFSPSNSHRGSILEDSFFLGVGDDSDCATSGESFFEDICTGAQTKIRLYNCRLVAFYTGRNIYNLMKIRVTCFILLTIEEAFLRFLNSWLARWFGLSLTDNLVNTIPRVQDVRDINFGERRVARC